MKPASTQAFSALSERGLTVQPVFQGSPLLDVNGRGLEVIDRDTLKAIEKQRERIAMLRLGGTSFDDASLKSLKSMPRLTLLDLHRSKITDAGLKKLAELPELRHLNLFDCRVSDQSVNSLANLKSLEFLTVYQSDISEEGVAQLQQALPKAKVVAFPKFPEPAADDEESTGRRRR